MDDPNAPGRTLEPNSPLQRAAPEGQAFKRVKFSEEDQEVMRRCRRESMWYRCVPLSVALSFAVHRGVSSGYLKRHPKYGAIPKIIGAIVCGYSIGKITYVPTCQRYLMALPNSEVGALLRKRKNMGLMNATTGLSVPVGETISSKPEAQTSHLDFDSYNSMNSGANDYYNPPAMEDGASDDPEELLKTLPPPGVAKTTTYSELRQKNRDEYELQRLQSLRPKATPDVTPPVTVPHRPEDSRQIRPPDYRSTTTPKAKNQYGDEWEL